MQVLKNCKLIVGGYDLSGDINALALNYGVDAVANDNFANDTHTFLPGLKMVDANHQGYWNANSATDPAKQADDVLFPSVGLSDVLVTCCPNNLTIGAPAYAFKAVTSKYSPSAKIGAMLGFSVEFQPSSESLRRGPILNEGSLSGSGTIAAAVGVQISDIDGNPITANARIITHAWGSLVTSGAGFAAYFVSNTTSNLAAPASTVQLLGGASHTAPGAWEDLVASFTGTYMGVKLTLTESAMSGTLNFVSFISQVP